MVQFALRHLDGAPELAQAIGNMIVAWAFAEDNIVISLHKATGMKANMALRIYHSVVNFDSKAQMVATAIEEAASRNSDADWDSLLGAVSELRKLSSNRNKLVHNAWQIDEDKKTIYNVSFRRRRGTRPPSSIIRPIDIT